MSEDNNLEWQENDLPYSRAFGDHFYSRRDGRLECDHVFLKGNAIHEKWAQGADFSIGELGFGTGLNLLETWRQWIELRQPNQHLNFTSFELYPMDVVDIERAIAPWPMLQGLCGELTSQWSKVLGGDPVALDPQTTLQLIRGDANEHVPAWHNKADAWFLDGFAPSKNPQMWQADLLAAIAAKTNPNGSFATYTVAGWVRRNLIAAGFEIEKCRGHAGKNQMLRGVLQSVD